HYKIWVEANLLKLIDIKHKNYKSAWVGFLNQRYFPDYKIIKVLKEKLIELVDFQDDFEDVRKIHDYLIKILMYSCYLSYNKKDDKKLFTDAELRIMLRKFDNETLGQGLNFVLNSIKKDKLWKKFVHYFFLNIWPKEDKYQTSRSSEIMFNFLIDMLDDFEDVFKYISPY